MRYTDDDALPEVTDEDLREAIGATKPYTIVVLRAGAGYSPPGPDRDPDVERVVWAHGKRNYALRAAGLMGIVRPYVQRAISTCPAEPRGRLAHEPGSFEEQTARISPAFTSMDPKAGAGGRSGHSRHRGLCAPDFRSMVGHIDRGLARRSP